MLGVVVVVAVGGVGRVEGSAVEAGGGGRGGVGRRAGCVEGVEVVPLCAPDGEVAVCSGGPSVMEAILPTHDRPVASPLSAVCDCQCSVIQSRFSLPAYWLRQRSTSSCTERLANET